VKYIICYPPPAFEVVWDIRNSILVSGVMPAVDSILELRDAVLVDFYNPLLDSVSLFPDYIHPNADGAKVMAKIAFDKIVESNIVHQVDTKYTFVISLDTKDNEIQTGDTAVISWTTRNATSVTLNGETVDLNGKIELTPSETTVYKLIAIGAYSTDSLTVTQNVYIPELTNISLTPVRSTITNGESKDLQLILYDQKLNEISDTTMDVTWSISEGEGSLINETSTAVTFVSSAVGKSKVKAEIGQLSTTSTITVEAGTGIASQSSQDITGYPNPCSSLFYIPVDLNGETQVLITFFNVLGKRCLSQNITLNQIGNYALPINVKDLKNGLYIYKLEIDGKIITGKLNKRN